ncbi:MAG: hypothetical protein KDB79_03705, partial [Acidobacteria bacterium]|nr:hypothetical protein [Acidobacteriota bacterium]
LVQFDIGSAIPGTLLFGWFAALGGIKFVFLPLLAIIFGVAVIAADRENTVTGIVSIVAGFLYFLTSIISEAANPFALEVMNDLVRPLVLFNLHSLIWPMIAIAVMKGSRIVRPFLILAAVLSFIIFLIGSIMLTAPRISLGVMVSTLVVISLIQLLFAFYIWNSVDDGNTRISPAIAVGGGIIPFLGTIWSMIILSLFPKSYDAYIDRNNLAENQISRIPFWTFIILFVISIPLFWIPYIGKIVVFGLFVSLIAMIAVGCSAVINFESKDLGASETLTNDSNLSISG